MSLSQFYKDFYALPEALQQEVADFAAFLKQRQPKDVAVPDQPRYLPPGFGKGILTVPPDFDEPMPDFEAYS